MGRFAEKYEAELRLAVGEAVANGAKATIVCQQLAAGTFPGWDKPVQMPIATVRYYGKRERQRRAAKAVRPEAKDAPKKAVDDLARLLLSAAMEGLEKARPGIDNDPKGLKEWADALKAINGLVSDTSSEKPAKTQREPVPKDPLSSRLLEAKPEKSAQSPTQADKHQDDQQPTTHEQTSQVTPRVGVAAQAPNTDHPDPSPLTRTLPPLADPPSIGGRLAADASLAG